MDYENTCCFTGHRPGKFHFGYDESYAGCVQLRRRLGEEIERMRAKGVSEFLTGMAQGTDIWAAEYVLRMRDASAPGEISLCAVIPFAGQEKRWGAQYRRRYAGILARADRNIVLNERYTRYCMHERNRYLVEHAAHMIAVFNGTPGGTQYTIQYGQSRGMDLVIIDPDEL